MKAQFQLFQGINISGKMDNLINQNEEIRSKNYDIEEIIIQRNRTTTYAYTEEIIDQITVEQILTVLEIHDIIDIECIQKIFFEGKPVFEITYTNVEERQRSEQILKGKLPINNCVLQQRENRKLKNTIKIPVIAVTLFETPSELDDEKILAKMTEYGEVKKEIYHHKIKHTQIKNGYRTIYYKNINKSIPTILWINGNRIKIRYEGQDRTPICSFCKVKGHYKEICETLKEITEKREQLQKEMEEEKEEEQNRDRNSQLSWAKIMDEKEEKEKEKERENENINNQNQQKKQFNQVVSGNTNKTDINSRKNFQEEMRRNREKQKTTAKKTDLSQKMAEIEEYNNKNVKRHIEKTEEQKKEEQEKKKKRKEAKKKRNLERKNDETISLSGSEMELTGEELSDWNLSHENFSV